MEWLGAAVLVPFRWLGSKMTHFGEWMLDAAWARWRAERRADAPAAPPAATPGVVHNVTSHNQSGGVTAHTVNVGRRNRTLSSSSANEFKRYVLTALSRDVEWDIVSILGDQEAFALAGEIHEFMKANGFKMQDEAPAQAVFTGPVEGICIEQTGKVIVGTNVNAPRSKITAGDGAQRPTNP